MLMDIEKIRFNMVEQQIRPWEVLDQNVLDLLFELHREDFVPVAEQDLAFVDMELPIGHGEVMLAPRVEARLLQTLQVRKTDKILEIGTGTGYMAALLAAQGRHVYSVDIQAEFTALAAANLKRYDIDNVTLETGDGARGWAQHGPYDVIVLSGSVPVLPQAFLEALNVGGRLVAVVGDAPVMKARLVTCAGPGHFNTTDLFETVIPPLRNAQRPSRFEF